MEMVWILPTRVRFVRNSTIQFSYLIPESALFEVFDSKKEVFKTKILKTSVAGDEGFEPPQTESESGVLPLHKSPVFWFRHGTTFIIIRGTGEMSRRNF